uniref:Uncharacterized protein n=1 Tax=Populus alba TaxID=43335 RepID=A0A4U5PRZ6_POPAL|nr:hypothetical protein D5086_0000186310 [Populus alba]
MVSNTSATDLENLWVSQNGDLTSTPNGWEIPTNWKKLQIGVPVNGFDQFVKVMRDFSCNMTTVTGYCVDIFYAAVEALPYAMTYQYIPFAKPDGKSAGTYNDLVYQVYFKQLHHTVTNVNELIRKGEYVGYQENSFVSGILKHIGFDESKLLVYNSPEERDELFSKGS